MKSNQVLYVLSFLIIMFTIAIIYGNSTTEFTEHDKIIYISSSEEPSGRWKIIYAIYRGKALQPARYIYCENKQEKKYVIEAYNMIHYKDFFKAGGNE